MPEVAIVTTEHKPQNARCNHGEASSTCPVCSTVILTEREEEFEMPSNQHSALDTLVQDLTLHSLAEIRCDHELGRDIAICNCGMWRSRSLPSVGEAKEAWARHALERMDFMARVRSLVDENRDVLERLAEDD